MFTFSGMKRPNLRSGSTWTVMSIYTSRTNTNERDCSSGLVYASVKRLNKLLKTSPVDVKLITVGWRDEHSISRLKTPRKRPKTSQNSTSSLGITPSSAELGGILGRTCLLNSQKPSVSSLSSAELAPCSTELVTENKPNMPNNRACSAEHVYGFPYKFGRTCLVLLDMFGRTCMGFHTQVRPNL